LSIDVKLKNVKVLLAINDEGEVIGKVTLDLAHKPYAEIVNLMVHPSYCGQGIGKRLVEVCIRIARIGDSTYNIL